MPDPQADSIPEPDSASDAAPDPAAELSFRAGSAQAEPARGHTVTRERLARIGHHFLSDEAEEERAYTLSVIGPEGPARALAPALCRAGVAEVWVREAGDDIQYRYQRIAHGRPSSGRSAGRKPPPIHLRLCRAASLAPDTTPERLLLFAGPADHELEHCYLLCKRLRPEWRPRLLALTMTACRDPHQAEQAYYRLARTLRRHLDLDLVSYGFLVEAAGEGTHHLHAPIDGPAAFIVQDWQRFAGAQTTVIESGSSGHVPPPGPTHGRT